MAEEIVGPGFEKSGFIFQKENEHIIQNVKRILMTRRGEQIGDLSFGSDVQKYLFMPDLSVPDLIAEIKNSVERCDPRIEITEVEFENFDNVSGELTLNLSIRKKSNGEVFETTLGI